MLIQREKNNWGNRSNLKMSGMSNRLEGIRRKGWSKIGRNSLMDSKKMRNRLQRKIKKMRKKRND